MAKGMICLLVLMWIAATAPAFQETVSGRLQENTESIKEQPFDFAPSWRTSDSDCGQVAAYYIARLHHKVVTIEEVKNELPIAHEEGINCAEIVSYLKKQGISYETIWIAPDRFGEMPLPAIVHIKNKIVKSGHFWVVLDYDDKEDEFVVLDTVFGGFSVVDGKQIRLPATGFAVVPNHMNTKLTTALNLGAMFFAGIGAGIIFHRIRTSLFSPVKSGAKVIQRHQAGHDS